ncbi:helix-turn-helix transcriptional regulator [bacterium]|nr:helix-turn-helix transcriptional regulator [bacterium]
MLKWSQEKLAEEANLTLKHISRIECGIANLHIVTLNRIALAFKTSPAEILGFTISPKHKANVEILSGDLIEQLKKQPKRQLEIIKLLLDELSKAVE